MARNIKLLVYQVKDVEKAKVFFSKFLDTEPYVASAYYVGYKVGDLEIGLTPGSAAGPIAYTDVDDIKSSLQAMTQAGALIAQDAKEVAKGLLVAQVKDANGNVVGLRQQLN